MKLRGEATMSPWGQGVSRRQRGRGQDAQDGRSADGGERQGRRRARALVPHRAPLLGANRRETGCDGQALRGRPEPPPHPRSTQGPRSSCLSPSGLSCIVGETKGQVDHNHRPRPTMSHKRGAAPDAPLFEKLVSEASCQPFSEWDFSYIESRLTSEPLPWDFMGVDEGGAGHPRRRYRGWRASGRACPFTDRGVCHRSVRAKRPHSLRSA